MDNIRSLSIQNHENLARKVFRVCSQEKNEKDDKMAIRGRILGRWYEYLLCLYALACLWMLLVQHMSWSNL